MNPVGPAQSWAIIAMLFGLVAAVIAVLVLAATGDSIGPCDDDEEVR